MMRILSMIFILLLSACGNAPSGVGTTATSTTSTVNTSAASTTSTSTSTTTTSIPTSIFLSSSSLSVKTDNSDSATITATVLDTYNAIISGQAIDFYSSDGQLSASSAVTDSTGKASVVFSSGPDKTNKTSTITANISAITPAISAQYPVLIAGSDITVSSTNTNVTTTTKDTLTITVLDAGKNPIYNTPVTITQSATGSGSVDVYAKTTNTDVNGNITATIAAINTGSVTLTISAVGTSKTQVYTATGTATAAFSITAPSVDPYSMNTGTNLTVTATIPTSVANVSFATSLGTWTGGSQILLNVSTGGSGSISSTLSSSNSGIANIQVYDNAVPSNFDSTVVVFSQPATSAWRVNLQSSANVLAPSGGGIANTVDLIAKVTDSNNQMVGGASVLFSNPYSRGTGESLYPVVVTTDSTGVAKSVFTSGTLSTGSNGVDVYATIIGGVVNSPYSTDQTNIVVGSTAASLILGKGTSLVSLDSANYQLPMSVLVSDGNGNAVSKASVSLKVFPVYFAMGEWYQDTYTTGKPYKPCHAVPAAAYKATNLNAFINEDKNRNNTLGFDEDVQHNTLTTICDPYTTIAAMAYQPNGRLDPPSASGGNISTRTVLTDSNGIASFNLTYSKASAGWITDEIIASTNVLGTEASSRIEFMLPYLASDAGPALGTPSFGK